MFVPLILTGIALVLLCKPEIFTNHMMHPRDTFEKIDMWLDRH